VEKQEEQEGPWDFQAEDLVVLMVLVALPLRLLFLELLLTEKWRKPLEPNFLEFCECCERFGFFVGFGLLDFAVERDLQPRFGLQHF
jgi:hypothetical protein